MTDKMECEIFIVMDDCGNYAVGATADEVNEVFDRDIGGSVRRTAKIIAKMAPAVLSEATVDIPDEAGSTDQVEAEAA